MTIRESKLLFLDMVLSLLPLVIYTMINIILKGSFVMPLNVLIPTLVVKTLEFLLILLNVGITLILVEDLTLLFLKEDAILVLLER